MRSKCVSFLIPTRQSSRVHCSTVLIVTQTQTNECLLPGASASSFWYTMPVRFVYRTVNISAHFRSFDSAEIYISAVRHKNVNDIVVLEFFASY